MLSRYAKAFTAFVTAFAVPFAGAVTATSDAGSNVTQGEWITALVAGLVAGFATAAIPNKPPKGQPSDPAISEQGYGAVELLVVVILLVLLVLIVAPHI